MASQSTPDGSAPRARGTRGRRPPAPARRRFSPAGAGNARMLRPRSSTPPVQPRGRGERSLSLRWTIRSAGSAPRARGTPRRPPPAVPRSRFSPAGAGNARPRRRSVMPMAVQPRGRGERDSQPSVYARFDGSAPRARGTLALDLLILVTRRFSPAGAGNAPAERMLHCKMTVQPRGRGERVATARRFPDAVGSAPRARGTRVVVRRYPGGDRFSPAGAGNAAASRCRR